MDDDLVLAARSGLLLFRTPTPEGARLDPPFLRYDPSFDPAKRAALIARLLAEAAERRRRE